MVTIRFVRFIEKGGWNAPNLAWKILMMQICRGRFPAHHQENQLSCRSNLDRPSAGGGRSCVIARHIIERLTPKYSCAMIFLIPRISNQARSGYFSWISKGTCPAASPIIYRFRITASIVFSSAPNCSKVKLWVYDWIFLMQLSISSTRIFQLRSGNINGLVEYISPHSRTKRIGRHQIHWALGQIL